MRGANRTAGLETKQQHLKLLWGKTRSQHREKHREGGQRAGSGELKSRCSRYSFSMTRFIRMSLGVKDPPIRDRTSGSDTYLLFVVGEFTLLVLFLDFVVIHSERDSVSLSLGRASFFFRSRRLPPLLSLSLLRSALLLQDPHTSKHRQQSARGRCPTDPSFPLIWRHQWWRLNLVNFSFFFFFLSSNGKRRWLAAAGVAVDSDNPRHSPGSLFRRLLLLFPKWNTVMFTGPRRQQTSLPISCVRQGRGGGEGRGLGGVEGGMHRLLGFIKIYQVL